LGVLGFGSDAIEVFLPGCGVTPVGDWCPTCRGIAVSFWRSRCPLYVGHESPNDAAPHPWRTKIHLRYAILYCV